MQVSTFLGCCKVFLFQILIYFLTSLILLTSLWAREWNWGFCQARYTIVKVIFVYICWQTHDKTHFIYIWVLVFKIIKWYQNRHILIRFKSLLCDLLTLVVMKIINCFDLHNHVLLNDDDLQEAYDKLYKEFVKSFRKSTEAKLENVWL